MLADHLARKLHEVARLRGVAQHIGRAHEELLQSLRRKSVPLAGFLEGIGHVGEHRHMKVRPAAVLNGKEPCAVQIGAYQAVLSKTHAVAVVGLGHVARGRVRKVDATRVADEGEEVFSVSLRIGRGAASRRFRELGREGLKVRQFGRGLRAVFAERNVGVEAARRNFRDELGEPFAFRL